MKILLFMTLMIFAFVVFSFGFINYAQAQIGTGTVDFKLDQPQGYGILAQGSSGEGIVSVIIKNVIFLFFTIGGLGTVIYFLWGAVDWILSGGDKEKVANARKKMTHAIIGLVLLALSFVMIRTVGNIIGFDPLGKLQLRNLGDQFQFVPNR